MRLPPSWPAARHEADHGRVLKPVVGAEPAHKVRVHLAVPLDPIEQEVAALRTSRGQDFADKLTKRPRAEVVQALYPAAE
jgi:hypothetical protein